MAKKKPQAVPRKVQRKDGASLANIEIVEGYKRDLMKLPPKKICVVGTCPSRLLAPFDDITWKIWTIGPGGADTNRWEALFEVHGKESWPDSFGEYMEMLANTKPPKEIWTEHAIPDWPANKVIPKDELFKKYGRMWFSSSISYALAMAMEENVTDLGIYGIDLESGEEYRAQFVGARYFIDVARLAGVNIHMPEGCGLLREPTAYPEGWETHLGHTIQSKLQFLQGMHAQKTAEHGNLAAQINGIAGEIAAFNFMKDMYVIHGEPPDAPVQQKIANLTLEQKLERMLFLLESK